MAARFFFIALLLLHPLMGAAAAINTPPKIQSPASHQNCCPLCTCGTNCACSVNDPGNTPPPKPAPIATAAEPILKSPQPDPSAPHAFPAKPDPLRNISIQSPVLATSSIQSAQRLCVWRT